MAFYFLIASFYASTAWYVYVMSEMSPILQADPRFTKSWHYAFTFGWPLLVLFTAASAVAQSALDLVSEAN